MTLVLDRYLLPNPQTAPVAARQHIYNSLEQIKAYETADEAQRRVLEPLMERSFARICAAMRGSQ